MVDWKKLHEKWDEVPEAEKKRIADLFRAKTREKLAELFRKESWAIFVYEEATGEVITEVRVKVKVDAGETPGEWFGEFYYDEFVPAFWGAPTTEGLKSYLETGEDEVSPKYNLEMTGMSAEEIEEELKGLPWPFSHGETIRLVWKPEDVEFTDKGKEQWDIYHRTYRREDLELMSIDELKRILKIKGLSTAGKKEELISRILGVPPPVAPPPPVVAPPPAKPSKEVLMREALRFIGTGRNYYDLLSDWKKYYPEWTEDWMKETLDHLVREKKIISPTPGFYTPTAPPVAPPPVAPPPAPPPKPPVKPPVPIVPEKGLAKADEKRLLTRFEAVLLERTITPARWRPMFDDRLFEWRDAFKDLPRDEAVSRAMTEVERLVRDVEGLAKPPKPPVVPAPPVPVEAVPPVPPIVIAPPVAPPPGVLRMWGMPFVRTPCPAHIGEGRPLDTEGWVLRSPYLETRLRMFALPTADPLFFDLCMEHKRKYGGAFEYFPRDTIEFWVGEAIGKGEVDIASLVGVGISDDYLRHCVRFYEENKAKAVQ